MEGNETEELHVRQFVQLADNGENELGCKAHGDFVVARQPRHELAASIVNNHLRCHEYSTKNTAKCCSGIPFVIFGSSNKVIRTIEFPP